MNPLHASFWTARPELRTALESLQPWVQAGVLAAVDVHAVALCADLAGEERPDVLLACALAVRAPRHGHVCVDLHGLHLDKLARAQRPTASPQQQNTAAQVALPVDRNAWATSVASSPMVRSTVEGLTPWALWGGLLYVDRYHRYEVRLARQLSDRFDATREVADPALLKSGLDALFGAPEAGPVDRQRLAAAMAVLRGATVVSGGPGTGKTYTVRNVLTLLVAQWVAVDAHRPLPRIAVAAPTGKAAARVVESLLDGLDAHIARAQAAVPAGWPIEGLATVLGELAPWTIHRLLGWRPDDPTRFRHHADNPLPYDIVVVDEASMVDLALMGKLIDALLPEARVVLLGDRHQLASVEAGSVLADLCGASAADGTAVRLSPSMRHLLAEVAGLDLTNTPSPQPSTPRDGVVFLTRTRRFRDDSGIKAFAEACVEGRVDDAIEVTAPWPTGQPKRLALQEDGRPVGGDIGRLTPRPGGALPVEARAAIRSGFTPYLELLRSGRQPRHDDDAALHAEVLQLLGGFRILCAHRSGPLGVQGMGAAAEDLLVDGGWIRPEEGTWYAGRPVLITRNDYGVQLFNGDIGIVVRDANGQARVAFAEGAGGVRYLSTVRLPDHQTVFAMTIHKSQGSEFDDVIVALPARGSRVLTRELVYTAVTRAKHRVTVLADEAVLRLALKEQVQRATGLADRLWEDGHG